MDNHGPLIIRRLFTILQLKLGCYLIISVTEGFIILFI